MATQASATSLNIDILCMTLLYLHRHDIVQVMRTCKAMHSYGLPFILRHIGQSFRVTVPEQALCAHEPWETKTFNDAGRWEAFIRTVEVEPTRWMLFVQGMSLNIASLNRGSLMSPMLKLLACASNLTSLHVEEAYQITETLVSTLLAAQCPLRHLSLFNLSRINMGSLARLPTTMMSMILVFGQSLIPGDEALLHVLSPFMNTLEALTLNYARLRPIGVAFREDLVFPRVKSLTLVDVHGYHPEYLSRSFPGLENLHITFTEFRPYWSNAIVERELNVQTTELPLWSQLNSLVTDAELFVRLGITCPIRHLTITKYQLTTIEGVHLVGDALRSARPNWLAISLSPNVSNSALETLLSSAGPNLRHFELSLPRARGSTTPEDHAAHTSALFNALAYTQVTDLYIHPNELAYGDSKTGKLSFFNERLDYLELYILKLASNLPSFRSVTAKAGPHVWLVERLTEGLEVEVKVRELKQDERIEFERTVRGL